MKSIFEEMGGTYSNINGYLIPNLTIPDSPPLGKWGRMRRRYLKKHHPALYSSMLLTGRLDQHLAEIDEACEERMELLTRQMAKQEGVTEVLKAADQMAWVRRMTSIHNRAEEIALREPDEGVKIIEPRGSNTTFYMVFIRRYCYNIVRMLYYIKTFQRLYSKTPLAFRQEHNIAGKSDSE